MSDISETTFNLKDAFMLVGGIISLLTSWFALKYGQKSADKEIVLLKEETISAKRGRHSLRKEFTDDMDKREEVITKRIDKTQLEQKEYAKKTDQEFKEINSNFSVVKSDVSEIKGMVQMLLTQKGK